jgi:hypothetical protein
MLTSLKSEQGQQGRQGRQGQEKSDTGTVFMALMSLQSLQSLMSLLWFFCRAGFGLALTQYDSPAQYVSSQSGRRPAGPASGGSAAQLAQDGRSRQ